MTDKVFTAKFFAKSVNDNPFADYQYVGSMSVIDISRAGLIRSAESIGGPINGPLIATLEGAVDIKVLKI